MTTALQLDLAASLAGRYTTERELGRGGMATGDPADAYFADGMTDEVRGKLTALTGLTVIAGASSNQYRHTTKTPQQIASELGVRYLLVGKVRWNKHGAGAAGGGQAAQSEVRVEPELMDVGEAARPTSKWPEPFDAPFTDVFATSPPGIPA